MHGTFGEDGETRILEKQNPVRRLDKNACHNCFDKYRSNELIKNMVFYASFNSLKIHEPKTFKPILEIFHKHKIKRAIINLQPAVKYGVYSVSTIAEALEAVHKIFTKRIDTRIVVEPFCTGIEFTVIILEIVSFAVALFPTEIEMITRSIKFSIFAKYLATRQVTYHCPPRFPIKVTEKSNSSGTIV